MNDKDSLIESLLKQIEGLQKQLEASMAREASRERLIEEQSQTISNLNAVINELRQVKADLEETVREFQRHLFGTSSEKTNRSSEGNDSNPLDDDAPDDATEGDDNRKQLHTYTVKEHTATRKPKSSRNDLYKDLPVVEKNVPAKRSECTCPWCKSQMEHLGFKYAREELRITPAKVQRVRIMKELLKCPECEKTGTSAIVEGSVPKPLLYHSPVSASLAAEVMYRKSKDYLTFYRMENDTLQLGALIPRETSSNWFIKVAEKYLLPIYKIMISELLTRHVLHADETTCQVLREEGKAPESTSYMWVYTTADDGLPQIVVYDYKTGRAGANAREFLKGFNGLLQCDGYAGYNLVEDVTLVICVAHLRRKFFEAIPSEDRKKIKLLDINSETVIKEPVIPERTATMSPAVIGVAYCNKLFYIERCIKDKTPEEKAAARKKLAAPVWDDFWEYVDSLHPVGGSKLETAVNYALNHKEGFMNYMLDGSCDLSNNKAERKCKNYALIRRNSLFHTSVKGAQASAVVSSIVETAAANNLNVYQYLYTVLLYMPDYYDEPAGIKALLPWSPFIQEHCTGLRDTETITAENHPDLPI